MKLPLLARTGLMFAVMAGSTSLGQVIRIKGSDTLGAKLVPALAESYKSQHEGSSFEISAEGSAVAFPALVNGTADLGMSSRKATAQELAAANAKGLKLVETVACHDMIVVIVNKANKVKSLTKDQISKIFTGAVKDWSEVGGAPGTISIYTRNTASGTYKDWQALAMAGKDYAPGSQKLAGSEQVGEEVSKNKNGIGYVGLAYSEGPGIRSVSIGGVAPVAEKAKEYAYSRACYYYHREDGLPAAKDFVAYAIGEEGKKLAVKNGFVPD
ncbi:phosphate ABC transporter substrate-binding protein [Luteolibacter sp. Populi]|uniref:phosphate ABC transporter substrate-binding protein n=1 Tax=Luteolibacter sp. Populi TaxID=3230487 RepID=UPI00346560A0